MNRWGFDPPPPHGFSLYFQQSYGKIDTPRASWKKENESEFNMTLMYYFHLGLCHRPTEKPSTLSHRILKDSNWLKLFDVRDCSGVYTKVTLLGAYYPS